MYGPENKTHHFELRYDLILFSELAHEFKCVTEKQRRRVKQGILDDFKGAFVPSTYSPKSERAYRDVNLSKSDEMRSLLTSLSPRLKDKMHHVLARQEWNVDT
ncbi:hypothetical protein KY285_028857 [Solanum tuberosum]|nr:hypothetical protein KY289_029039 [Solanum tuberosum]KAH0667651.1 hypothetical protein KY285_028857 [Solanum tuberosum]